MVTIRLGQVRFHALHGVYDGEPLVGGDFEVSLEVDYEDTGLSFTSLVDTISYVDLFDIVKEKMHITTPLLEKIAKDILDAIILKYPHIKGSRISIDKLQPPVVQFQGRLGVTMSRMY